MLCVVSCFWRQEKRWCLTATADKFFSKEVTQKQAIPFPRQDLLTARKSFLNKFPGMAPG